MKFSISGVVCLEICVLLLLPLPARADKIYLKDGSMIEGKITNETEYNLKIKIGELIRTFYSKDIQKIEKDEDAAQKKKREQELAPEKKELILQLLKANHARDNMQNIFNQIIEQAPKETREELAKMLKADDIIERLVPVYSKYYTSDEIKDLISFYESQTGQKHLQQTPALLNDTLVAAVQYFEEKVAQRQ